MGYYAFCMSACYGCGVPFTYNPNSVPSVMVEGKREPICLKCVNRANPEREKRGLEKIVPLPDAYEPVDENELLWDSTLY